VALGASGGSVETKVRGNTLLPHRVEAGAQDTGRATSGSHRAVPSQRPVVCMADPNKPLAKEVVGDGT
jgi:hypothetical protein